MSLLQTVTSRVAGNLLKCRSVSVPVVYYHPNVSIKLSHSCATFDWILGLVQKNRFFFQGNRSL